MGNVADKMAEQYPHSDKRIRTWARKKKVAVNDLCCVCLEPINVMAFKGTGVCCEDHRKTRDNDHEPFKAVNLDVTKDGIKGGK